MKRFTYKDSKGNYQLDNDYVSGKGIDENGLDEITDYIGELEDLEEQLDCPLDVVFKALQLIKTKSKKNYNLALVVDSGTYEKYCEQFKYFLDDYKEKGGAFEIWEEDRFSLEEYSLLREVFVYEHR